MIDIGKIWPGWEIEELIGQGSYGRVYRVRREEMGERYYAALKVIEIPQDEAEIASLMSMGMDNLSIRDYYEETAKNITAEIRLMETLKSGDGLPIDPGFGVSPTKLPITSVVSVWPKPSISDRPVYSLNLLNTSGLSASPAMVTWRSDERS